MLTNSHLPMSDPRRIPLGAILACRRSRTLSTKQSYGFFFPSLWLPNGLGPELVAADGSGFAEEREWITITLRMNKQVAPTQSSFARERSGEPIVEKATLDAGLHAGYGASSLVGQTKAS
jgi:hypothetical protein